jgi:hypothetical protein
MEELMRRDFIGRNGLKAGGFLALIMILLFTGCQALNDKEPSSIKEIAAYKEGNGIVIYFILADADGAMTTSDGTVNVNILAAYGDKDERILYGKQLAVRKKDFKKTEVGMGNFKREVILYPIGRIPYSAFKFDAGKTQGWVEIIFYGPENTSIHLHKRRIIFLESRE